MIDFHTFDTIENLPLRAYNRATVFHNIFEDQGKGVAQEYVNQFSYEERLHMAQITKAVKKFGKKFVLEQITKGMVFPEYMTEEESANVQNN